MPFFPSSFSAYIFNFLQTGFIKSRGKEKFLVFQRQRVNIVCCVPPAAVSSVTRRAQQPFRLNLHPRRTITRYTLTQLPGKLGEQRRKVRKKNGKTLKQWKMFQLSEIIVEQWERLFFTVRFEAIMKHLRMSFPSLVCVCVLCVMLCCVPPVFP